MPGIWKYVLGTANDALNEGRAIEVTSWWRDYALNRGVGGHPRSQHLFGLALDIKPDSELLAVAFRKRGWVVIPEGTHLHVQVYPADAIPRWVFRQLGIPV